MINIKDTINNIDKKNEVEYLKKITKEKKITKTVIINKEISEKLDLVAEKNNLKRNTIFRMSVKELIKKRKQNEN